MMRDNKRGSGIKRDIDEGQSKIFDNTKDALIFIAQKHGYEVLLGKQLKAFFPDYAPQVSANIKSLVFAVYEKGVAAILQDYLNAEQEDKEIAFKQAVAKLTEAFITEEAAENIISEFTEALGWQLSVKGHTLRAISKAPLRRLQTAQPPPIQRIMAPMLPKRVSSLSLPSSQQSKQRSTTYQSGVARGAAAEVIQGRRRNIKFGEYEWRVLDIQGDKALLLTEDVIETRPYNTKYADVTWESCTLRQYLNCEFLGEFSSYEQAGILEICNTNPNNQWYDAMGGNDTVDKVFLLSIDEVVKYFGDSGDLANRKGWYWQNSKDEIRDGNGYFINDKYNNERVGKFVNNTVWWWLRSPGDGNSGAAGVDDDGSLGMLGATVTDEEGGVRPALWLNLSIEKQMLLSQTEQPAALSMLPIQMRQKLRLKMSLPTPPTQIQQAPLSKYTHQSGLTMNAADEIRQGERRNINFGGYKWRVLKIRNDRALLLTEGIIDRRTYNAKQAPVTWESCTLRQYLNGEFFREFNSHEQAVILETRHSNPNNQWYGTRGGNDTADKVFLLSIDEVVKYFGDSGDLANHKGWYWENDKIALNDGKGYIINDEYNSERALKYRNGVWAWWWLRSPGYCGGLTVYVRSDGSLNLDGRGVDFKGGGVRPAIWLNLKF
ncbi:MAG: DUF6273 domain-containing protein [Clostridiales Family XIII bacterium]|jgi:hypothetical protein|nr:DUF6273 domain-containing protein [Clostridiales Family XIII bacterium]